MAYVLITADFPEVTSDQLNKIYECLNRNNIIKITEFGRDISTSWIAYFTYASEQDAIKVTIEHFINCSNPHCKPKLVLQWGPNKPTLHGLT